jgi:hopanoid-associated phosphorylase
VILVATGLRREARTFAGPGVTAIAGGGDAARLEAGLDAQAGAARAILSTGLAGALAPDLAVGDWVIGGDPAAVDAAWARRLHALFPAARSGPIHADGTAIASAGAKRAIHAASGAIAVDMESHVAARVAARHGLPFAILRVISDAADQALPPAALIGMKPDGGMAIGAVLASLARHPGQLPALIRAAIGAERAFRALLRGHDVLARGGFGLADQG